MSEADFLTTDPPEAVELPVAHVTGPKRFFNRELSWLAFNWRVLEEAENPAVPLLERVRFVSISATNLDEFYTVRVAGLRELEREGNQTPAADGLTPSEQLELINADARKLLQTQQTTWNRLRKELEGKGIRILTAAKLTKADRTFLDGYFRDYVFPVLSPLAIDPAHPFPFIPNTGLSLALQLRRTADGADLQALLPIPAQVDRFTVLPAEAGDRKSVV